MPSKSLWVFPICLALASLLRAKSFLLSVIDGDEAAYLLMARALKNGAPLYTTVFDHKPPGIYFIYALAESLLGSAIPAIRVAACIAVAITAYLLFMIARRMAGGTIYAAILAASLYLIFSLEIGGLAANTEVFFAPFITYAFGEALNTVTLPAGERPSVSRLLGMGIAAGCAFQIKYVVMLDVALVMAIPALVAWRQGDRGAALARAPLWILLGIGIPTAAVVAYFVGVGHVHEYLYSNFTANAIHAKNSNLSVSWVVNSTLNELSGQWLPVLGTLLMIVFAARHRRSGYPSDLSTWLAIAWFLTSFVGVQMPRRLYAHYFLQLLPAMCLLSGCFMAWLLDAFLRTNAELRFRGAAALTLLVGGPLLATALPQLSFALQAGLHRFARGEAHWGDPTARVADHLRSRMRPDDGVYVFDDETVLYLLLDRPAPTRYAFPAFITSTHFSQVANVDPVHELEAILKQHPRYVVRRTAETADTADRNAAVYARMDAALASGYEHDATVADSEIFQRVGP